MLAGPVCLESRQERIPTKGQRVGCLARYNLLSTIWKSSFFGHEHLEATQLGD